MPDNRAVAHKIDDDMPTEVLRALATSLGFSLLSDPSPDTDVWILSAVRSISSFQRITQYAGTRRSMCAFLIGYSAMRIQTTQLLNDIEREHSKTLFDVRRRLLGDNNE